MSKCIPDDEDVDAFIPLFAHMISTNARFESTILGFINRYEQPPTENEVAPQTLLDMGEKWLMERARYDVLRIPG